MLSIYLGNEEFHSLREHGFCAKKVAIGGLSLGICVSDKIELVHPVRTNIGKLVAIQKDADQNFETYIFVATTDWRTR